MQNTDEATVAVFPADLRQYLPRPLPQGYRILTVDDPLDAAGDTSLLAATHLPAMQESQAARLPPVYALSPALWRDPPLPLVGRADQGHRGVASRALETLLALTGHGPLPPSPRGLRQRGLRDGLSGTTLALGGGGKVGRAVLGLAREARIRVQMLSDHAPAALRPEPWDRVEEVLGRARDVIWATDRPIAPYLRALRPGCHLVLAGDLAADDLKELLATLPSREATALTLYRPRDLPKAEGLVVLSDSPRRLGQAMAQFLRHLTRHP